MSISRAQAKALADGFVDTFGRKPPEGELPVIDVMLAAAAKDFIETVSANLENTDAINTGALQSELRFEVETNAGNYLMSVGYDKSSKAAKYWDYVNKGVKGVNDPSKAPQSPYKFKFLGVTKKHALAILLWYRQSGRGAANLSPKHPVSGIERKRISARKSINEADSLKSLAYATAMKSKKEGLRATEYFDNAVETTFGPSFIEALQVALGGEVIIRVKQEGL